MYCVLVVWLSGKFDRGTTDIALEELMSETSQSDRPLQAFQTELEGSHQFPINLLAKLSLSERLRNANSIVRPIRSKPSPHPSTKLLMAIR